MLKNLLSFHKEELQLKITIINGQNHKGSTYHIGRILADKLALEKDITEYFLPKDMPAFCLGCNQCFLVNESKCPHYQYTQPIIESIDNADVLIFTTPVYVYHCTGSMKVLLDHLAFRWMVHRPNGSMFKKQAICISSAAGSGMTSACKDMKHSMFAWGVGKIYTYGVRVSANSWNEVSPKVRGDINLKTDGLAKNIKKNNNKVRPPLKTKGFFLVARMLNKKSGWNEVDVTHWKTRGWDNTTRPWHHK